MKVIIGTLIICLIVVYVYIDYDNIKAKLFGDNKEKEITRIEESKVKDGIGESKEIKTAKETKFKEDEELYINASVGDLMSWEQNRVPAWITYDGSANSESQRVIDYFNHREIVKVIKVVIGEGGKVWYYVRTPKGFPISGWVEEKYLSKEAPLRRRSQPPDRGM